MNHARKIKASKGKHYRWKIPFLKNGKMVHCESTLEKDFVRLADFDRSISEVIHQPLAIYYYFKRRRRVYYPDYKMVTSAGKIIIVEVKPQKYVRKVKNEIKFIVGRMYCEERGWEYHIVTEQQIRLGYLQRNLGLLRGLGHQYVSMSDLKLVLDTLKNSGESTIEMLRENCIEMEEATFFKIIYKLIYHQKIYVDLIGSELSDISYVSVQK
jgi:hypothetical protein